MKSGRVASQATLTYRTLRNTLRTWHTTIPYIQPYQAVKAFPEPRIIKFLAEYDETPTTIGFDCASATEIALVTDFSTNIIFANPTKSIFDIKYATDHNVHTFVVDSIEEIQKIQLLDPLAKFVIRILANETYSRLPFNSKFGANELEIGVMLQYLQNHNLQFHGFSYHSGSLCDNMRAHQETMNTIVNTQMPLAESFGFTTEVVDIGGGFQRPEDLAELHRNITYFLPSLEMRGTHLIAEPGRLFAHGCLRLTLEVIAVRRRGDAYQITLNDSIQHTLQGKIYDDQIYTPIPVGDMTGRPLVRCVIFGQTCDSRDVIHEDVVLPLPALGDKQMFQNVGAQSLASANGNFNGFSAAEVIVEERA